MRSSLHLALAAHGKQPGLEEHFDVGALDLGRQVLGQAKNVQLGDVDDPRGDGGQRQGELGRSGTLVEHEHALVGQLRDVVDDGIDALAGVVVHALR